MVKVRERKYFLGSIQSEKLIRLNGLKKVDPHSNQLYSMACKFLNKYQKIKIDKAYSFAKKSIRKTKTAKCIFTHPAANFKVTLSVVRITFQNLS